MWILDSGGITTIIQHLLLKKYRYYCLILTILRQLKMYRQLSICQHLQENVGSRLFQGMSSHKVEDTTCTVRSKRGIWTRFRKQGYISEMHILLTTSTYTRDMWKEWLCRYEGRHLAFKKDASSYHSFRKRQASLKLDMQCKQPQLCLRTSGPLVT